MEVFSYSHLGPIKMREHAKSVVTECWGGHKKTGCKESQFYSLPFGQAVASMY